MMNRVELKEEMMEAVVGGESWGEDLWNGFVELVMPHTTEFHEDLEHIKNDIKNRFTA